MPPAVCSLCWVLYDKASQAIIRHTKLVANLEIADIRHDKKAVAKLRSLVEEAGIEREQALAKYRSHARSHAKAAEL
jgi:hypothetical protein